MFENQMKLTKSSLLVHSRNGAKRVVAVDYILFYFGHILVDVLQQQKSHILLLDYGNSTVIQSSLYMQLVRTSRLYINLPAWIPPVIRISSDV